MDILKKVFKIQWMRTRLWILIIGLGLLTLSVSFLSGNFRYYAHDFNNMNYIDMVHKIGYGPDEVNLEEKLLDLEEQVFVYSNEFENIDEYDKTYIDQINEKYYQVLDRFDLVENISQDQDSNSGSRGTYYVDIRPEDQYIDEAYFNLIGDLESFRYFVLNHTVEDANGSLKIQSDEIYYPGIGPMFFAIFLAIVLMSAEHLTNYYEFTRLYPWKRRQEFIYKILYGLVALSVFYLIVFLINYLASSRSIIHNLIGPIDYKFVLMDYIRVVSYYLIAMSIGAMAGNILGHLGMMLIAFMGTTLIDYNYLIIQNAFLNNEYDGFLILDALQGTNGLALGFLNPYTGYLDRIDAQAHLVLIGLVLAAALYMVLGLYYSQNADSSRSKMLVMPKPISVIVEIFAVVTTASIFFMISQSLFSSNWILSIVMYLIGLGVSFKFYNAFFRVQMGI